MRIEPLKFNTLTIGAIVFFLSIVKSIAKGTDEYCSQGMCTLTEQEFETALDNAFQIGRRSSASKECQIIVPNDSGGGGSEYFEVMNYWHVFTEMVDSELKFLMKYHPLDVTVGGSPQFWVGVNSGVVEWAPELNGPSRSINVLQDPEWAEVVNMNPSGAKIVENVLDGLFNPLAADKHYAFISSSVCSR